LIGNSGKHYENRRKFTNEDVLYNQARRQELLSGEPRKCLGGGDGVGYGRKDRGYMEQIPRDRERNGNGNNSNSNSTPGAKAEDLLSVKSYYFKTEIFRLQELLKGKQGEIKVLMGEIETEKYANRDKTFEAENLRKVLRETGDQLDALNSENNDLRGRMANLEILNIELTQANAKSTSDAQMYKSDYLNVDAIIDQLQERFCSENQSFVDFREINDYTQKGLCRIEEALTSKTETILRLERDNQEKIAQIDLSNENFHRLSSELTRKATDLTRQGENFSNISDDYGRLQETYVMLKSEGEKRKDLCDEYETRLRQVSRDCEELQTSLGEKEIICLTLDRECGDLKGKLKDSEAREMQRSSELNHFRNESETRELQLSTNLNHVRDELDFTIENLKRLEEQLLQEKTQKETLTQKCGCQNRTIDEIQEKTNSQSITIQSLEN
jgi:chromosome segregation ATPase